MPLTNFTDYLEAPKQDVVLLRSATWATSGTGTYHTVQTAMGIPASNATVALSNATSGFIPIDSTGFNSPAIQAYAFGNGYITSIDYGNNFDNVNMWLYDRVYSAGVFAMGTTANTYTLSGQPSFADRVPLAADGLTRDFRECELWFETATALSNHAHNIAVNYTDQNDVAANTGNISSQNLPTGRFTRMPLQAGTEGIKQINSVTAVGVTSATGSFNIHILRPLARMRAAAPAFGGTIGPEQLGLIQISSNAALFVLTQGTSSNHGFPFMRVQIANY